MQESSVNRKTKETDISLQLSLNNYNTTTISSGIPFFDHMLEQLAKHAKINLKLQCKGDTEIDFHHTVEDIGICLGKALSKTLGNRAGIKRYGHSTLPMEESLISVALDLSNRGLLVYNTPFNKEKIANFDVELIKEFFRALSLHGGITLHINVIYGDNLHHIAEGIFKGFAHALKTACSKDPNNTDIPSTKGML